MRRGVVSRTELPGLPSGQHWFSIDPLCCSRLSFIYYFTLCAWHAIPWDFLCAPWLFLTFSLLLCYAVLKWKITVHTSPNIQLDKRSASYFYFSAYFNFHFWCCKSSKLLLSSWLQLLGRSSFFSNDGGALNSSSSISKFGREVEKQTEESASLPWNSIFCFGLLPLGVHPALSSASTLPKSTGFFCFSHSTSSISLYPECIPTITARIPGF